MIGWKNSWEKLHIDVLEIVTMFIDCIINIYPPWFSDDFWENRILLFRLNTHMLKIKVKFGDESLENNFLKNFQNSQENNCHKIYF